MGKNKWLCTICDVRCLTEKRWNGHNNSKKHAKKYKLWVRSQGSGVKPPVANLPPGRPKHGSGVKPPAVANLPPGGPKHGKGVISTAHLPDQAKTATTEIAHPINARKKKQVKLATELSHRPKQAYGQPSAQKKEVNRATQHRGKEPSGAAATTHRAKVVKKATPHHPKHGHGPSLIHSPNQGPGLPGVAANLKDTSLDQGGRPSAENGGGLSKQSKQQLLQVAARKASEKQPRPAKQQQQQQQQQQQNQRPRTKKRKRSVGQPGTAMGVVKSSTNVFLPRTT